MTDDNRIGIKGGKKPTHTICGYPIKGQYLSMVGIGNNQYVIIGANDNRDDITVELERLKAANIPKRGANERTKKDS